MMTILSVTQFFFTLIIGMYFLGQMMNGKNNREGFKEDSKKEAEQLNKMRTIHLSEPMTEKARPACLEDIIGQDDGLKALRAALCGPNPQHVIIYGPPGVGKTAAARVVMEEAKRSPGTPFLPNARFVETDATTMRFDERSIADPLIGSVHDPIYQGAGAYGNAGVPQPKPGAVSKAHGGVLFIDEIGELHSLQINKLLKVLEDRCVHFESAYYSSSNKNIPTYIHDIFESGLPADFRLIGATTRSPEEIPPAIRSRCMEIYFNALTFEDLRKIVDRAAKRIRMDIGETNRNLICDFAKNGRDAVRILQTVDSVSKLYRGGKITTEDVIWVLESGHYITKNKNLNKTVEKFDETVYNSLYYRRNIDMNN